MPYYIIWEQTYWNRSTTTYSSHTVNQNFFIFNSSLVNVIYTFLFTVFISYSPSGTFKKCIFYDENGSSKKFKIVSHCESKTGIRKKFSFSIIVGFSRSLVAFKTCVIFDFLIFDSERSSCAPRYKNGKTSDGEFDLKNK